MREVLEDEQRAIDHGRVVGRDLQLVDRFVEAGVGVHVRAEPHAERLHEGADGIAGKVPRAVEGHVLDEVRHAALVFVLEHGAGLDGEPQLGARLRLPVLPDVVAEAVRERADRDQRVNRDDLVEPGGLDRGWDRRLLGAGQAQGGGNRGDENQEPEASMNSHGVIHTKSLRRTHLNCSQVRASMTVLTPAGTGRRLEAHLARPDSFDGRFHYCRAVYRPNPRGFQGTPQGDVVTVNELLIVRRRYSPVAAFEKSLISYVPDGTHEGTVNEHEPRPPHRQASASSSRRSSR